MTRRVQLSDEARRQLHEIDAWWIANRLGSPEQFLDELERAIALIQAMPLIGRRYRAVSSAVLRRLLLRRSKFHVYYVVRDDELVEIVAIWNARRGHGPRLP